MTPIEKNIIVVDENGNKYEATYPKRADGLVKNGRARFIDKNTICLACPPDNKSEDNNMSENKINDFNQNTDSIQNNGAAEISAQDFADTAKQQQQPTSSRLTVDYLLDRLEVISLEQSALHNAISELGKAKSGGPGDVGTQAKANALGEVIKAREATNQKLIALYEKMYDDLTGKGINSERRAIIGALTETLGEYLTPMEAKEALTEALEVALQDFTKNI